MNLVANRRVDACGWLHSTLLITVVSYGTRVK
jgi:hypothetical protein